jgi:hypothetical protein
MSEDLDRDDFDLGALFEAHRDALQDALHTALPGRVESYDADAQTADVAPQIKRALSREDGTLVYETMPTIRAVPIVYPRWGSWFMHAPLTAGDTVLLVCCERDIAQWRQTGQLSPPLDVRHHHLAHAVALPGLFPRSRQLASLPTDALVIGRDGGSTIHVKQSGEVEVKGTTVKLGASATKGVARLNDSVQVTIPMGTFLTSATGGVLNASPVPVDGQITSASSNVKAID